MGWVSSDKTLGPFFSSEAMARIFSDRSRIQAMLDVEAALARAEAACGVIPEAAARVIAEVARAENFDAEALGKEVVKVGTLNIPFVKALTRQVAERDEEAARWVHWGATSQDIVDTGLVLQMREALTLIRSELEAIGDRLAALAEQHAETPIVARSLLQHAIPTTLGFKIAGWLSALMRVRQSLDVLEPRVLVLQFGGAAGNLASLHPDGLKIAEALASELRLTLPDLPWHGQRDRIAEMGAMLAILIGDLGKMARDLALMSQTEIGEFSEPSGDGRGGSSTMPHKANPVACARIIAAAKRAPGLAASLLAAMDQEHERGLGGWHAEWEVLPELFRLASAALEGAVFLAEHGSFHPQRMRANLDLTSGLVMAEAVSFVLARKIGKAAAHRLLEHAAKKAVAEKTTLRASIEADPEIAQHFDKPELDALFAPENHLVLAPDFARRAVASWRLSSRR